MSNKIHFKAPDLNFRKTADPMMLRSTVGLDQGHVLSEKIEAIAGESLNPIWSSFISSTPSYLETSDLNFPKTADPMMLRSTGGLDQGHVLSEKIEAIAGESLNPIWSSFISSTPPYLETSDSNFQKTAQELMLDQEAQKIAAHALLSLKNPSSSYPNTSNPDQGLFLSGPMLVRTESKPPQPTNDEKCDPLNPLLSKKVKGSKAPRPSTSYLYPAENSPNQNQNRLSPKDANPQLMGISDREWFVVGPLLRKKLKCRGVARLALNSILLIAINGVAPESIPTKTNFSKKSTVYYYFDLWQRQGTFEDALCLLADKIQGPLQPYYRSLLNNFKTLSKGRVEPLKVKMLRNLMSPAESEEFQGITDEEWILVEPLFSKKHRNSLRSILNSIFFILIDGSIGDEIPLDPNFVTQNVACRNFFNWRKTGTFEEVLVQLIGVTQGSLQWNYQNLLDKLKANPYSKTGHLPISKFKIERAISRSSTERRRKAGKEALSQGSQLSYDFMNNDTPPPKISKPNFPEMTDLIMERPIDGLNDCVEKT